MSRFIRFFPRAQQFPAGRDTATFGAGRQADSGLPGRLPDPGVGVGFGVRGLHRGRYSTEWMVTQPLASPVDFTRVGLPGVELYLPFSLGEISLCASNDTPPKRDISLHFQFPQILYPSPLTAGLSNRRLH